MRIQNTNDPALFNLVVESEGGRRDLIGSGWVAEILGTDPEYGYRRAFVAHKRGDNMWFDLRSGFIYEYRNIYTGGSKYAYQKHGGESGFFRIADGNWEDLSDGQVRNLLRAQVKVESRPESV
jgi:hypothetical protein